MVAADARAAGVGDDGRPAAGSTGATPRLASVGGCRAGDQRGGGGGGRSTGARAGGGAESGPGSPGGGAASLEMCACFSKMINISRILTYYSICSIQYTRVFSYSFYTSPMSGPFFAGKPAPQLSAERAGGACHL